MIKKNRLIYADILRIYSTFLVLLLHFSGIMWTRLDITSFDWRIINIYNTFSRTAVPIFVMLSGIFFLNPKKNISITKLYKKYILRIFISLIFWSIIYLILFPNLNFNIVEISNVILKGNTNYHLWYLYMLIGLYILTPIIRVFIKNSTKKDLEYFIIIILLFYFSVNFLPNIAIFSYIKMFTSKMLVFNISPYIFYYVLGYYLSTYKLSKKSETFIYIIGFLSMIFSIYITRFYTLSNSKQYDAWQYPNNLNIALYTIAVFLLIKNLFSKSIDPNSFAFKILDVLSSCSFGIFLTHDIMIKICLSLNVFTNLKSPILFVPILTIVDFILCFLFTFIFRKLFKHSNYIM